MLKPTSAMKICVIISAVFLLCSCVTYRTSTREGGSGWDITVENGKVTEEKCIGDPQKCSKGAVDTMKMVDTQGTPDGSDDVSFIIESISDHTIIRLSRPVAGDNCTDYWFEGIRWRVCY